MGVTAASLAAMRSKKDSSRPLSCFGFRFAADGKYFCRPEDVDLFLEGLDRAAATAGLTRDTSAGVKSSVRLVGSDTALLVFEKEIEDNWVTDRIV